MSTDVSEGFYRTAAAAFGLSKRDVFKLPDPYAIITVNGQQSYTTGVAKKTLNPVWNESFDMCVWSGVVVSELLTSGRF